MLESSVYQCFSQGVNQNVGGSKYILFGESTNAVISQRGVSRAIVAGYSISFIQSWINEAGPIVGSVVKSMYGLKPKK